MTPQRVGVLMGGVSGEREISLRSGQAMLAAYRRQGIHVLGLDLDGQWPQIIADAGIDAAIIALHGRLGEDGCVQGLLEILGIPYSGSGVLASSLCMHKRMCKRLLAQAGLKVPVDILLGTQGPARYPVVVKPINEGSSIGLRIVHDREQWQRLAIGDASAWMAEMPVKGVEVAVSLLNGEALPPVEVVPASGLYDFDAKYTKGTTEYFCPARLPAETLKRCMLCAEQAAAALDCRGAPRVDMIVADGGEPVILEVNTIPGMTATSLLPKAAAAAGIDFDHLCLAILEAIDLDHRRNAP